MLQNLGSKSYQLAVRPCALSASTGVGSAIDLNDYEGDIVFSLDASAGGSGITYAVKITESDTSGTRLTPSLIRLETSKLKTLLECITSLQRMLMLTTSSLLIVVTLLILTMF